LAACRSTATTAASTSTATTATTLSTATTTAASGRSRRGRSQRSILERNIIRTGVDHSDDGLAIPIHRQENLISGRPVRPPVAEPGAFERVSFLRKADTDHERKNERTGQYQFSSPHLLPPYIPSGLNPASDCIVFMYRCRKVIQIGSGVKRKLPLL
jgi:hypothetical protein